MDVAFSLSTYPPLRASPFHPELAPCSDRWDRNPGRQPPRQLPPFCYQQNKKRARVQCRNKMPTACRTPTGLPERPYYEKKDANCYTRSRRIGCVPARLLSRVCHGNGMTARLHERSIRTRTGRLASNVRLGVVQSYTVSVASLSLSPLLIASVPSRSARSFPARSFRAPTPVASGDHATHGRRGGIQRDRSTRHPALAVADSGWAASVFRAAGRGKKGSGRASATDGQAPRKSID